MRTLFSVAFAVMFAVLATVTSTPASAEECKKYEYTVPAGVKILTGEEISAALTGNTVDAWNKGHRLYFAENDKLVLEKNRMTFHGTWKVCGNVLVMTFTVNRYDRVTERVLAYAGEKKLAFFDLDGKNEGDWPVIKGKDF